MSKEGPLTLNVPPSEEVPIVLVNIKDLGDGADEALNDLAI